MTSIRRRVTAFRMLEWAVTAIVALPFLLPGWLPFTDLHEHAAAMASIAHYGDPSYRIAEHYFVAWSTSQYLLVHLVGAGLTALLGDANIACRISMLGLVVAWVESSRWMLRTFGGDPRVATLSALLVWNRAVVVGFLPYLVSLPLLFCAIAAYESGDPRTPRRRAGLAVGAVVVFYAHASAFTLLCAITGALALLAARGRPAAWARDVVARLLWLLPAVVFAVSWAIRGRIGARGPSLHDGSEVGTMNPLRAIKLIATYAHDIWPTHVDDAVGIGFWLLFLVLLVTGARSSSEARTRSLVVFAVAFVVYLVTPFRVGTGVLLNVRMAPVLAVFALLGLRPARGLVTNVSIAFAAILAIVQCVDNVTQMRRLQRDVAGLPELIARMPRGSRLITLNFSGFDVDAAHFTPWLHVGSQHRVLHGGVASFSFADVGHWSLQYRPEMAPPRQEQLSWGMRPCLFRNARDGAYFDYVLARGALDPFATHPPGPKWRVVGRTVKYTLYEKTDEPSTPGDGTEDPGPCPTTPPS